MAIIIKTKNPQKLIKLLNEAIENQEILTWNVDQDGDYTITRDQWRYHAWFRPREIKKDELIFGIVQSRKYSMTRNLYGIYHGRFVATLLSHFDELMDDITVSPLLKRGVDIVQE